MYCLASIILLPYFNLLEEERMNPPPRTLAKLKKNARARTIHNPNGNTLKHVGVNADAFIIPQYVSVCVCVYKQSETRAAAK